MTQTVCISGVHATVHSLGSMRSAVVMTIRKFISLILSIIVFAHDFGYKHAIGTVLVITGTLVHTIARQRRVQREKATAKKKES